jgi:DNA-binding transcriptional ArsR family regulator
MRQQRPRALVLRRRDQLDAMASPPRVALFQQLTAGGPASIADLARALGRSPHSLYYHVHALENAGVLIRTQKRRGGRTEAVYAAAARHIGLPYRPGSKVLHRAITRSASAVLRQTERTFHRAIRGGGVRDLQHGADAQIKSRRAWLTPRALARLQRQLTAMDVLLESENRRLRGRLYLVTSVLAPVPEPTRRRRQP